MKNKLIIVLITLLFSGCAYTNNTIPSGAVPELQEKQLSQWDMLIGKWHGKQPTDNGGSHEWLVDRQKDGTYQIQFRTHKPDGTTQNKVEVGFWGSSGAIYFSIYKADVIGDKLYPSDPSNPAHYDAYHILSLTEKKFKYRHARTGYQFEVIKVPNDFSLE